MRRQEAIPEEGKIHPLIRILKLFSFPLPLLLPLPLPLPLPLLLPLPVLPIPVPVCFTHTSASHNRTFHIDVRSCHMGSCAKIWWSATSWCNNCNGHYRRNGIYSPYSRYAYNVRYGWYGIHVTTIWDFQVHAGHYFEPLKRAMGHAYWEPGIWKSRRTPTCAHMCTCTHTRTHARTYSCMFVCIYFTMYRAVSYTHLTLPTICSV